MHYILKHITQLRLPTVMLLSVGALCMWIPSFMQTEKWWLVLVTMLLCVVNTVMMMLLCFNGNITKMFDLFSGFTFLVMQSALKPWHSCWQAQMVVLLLLTCGYVFEHIDRHQIGFYAEYAFLMSILIGLASYWLPSVLLLILPLMVILAMRQTFDGQSFIAILMGLGLVALYAGLMVWLGWLQPSWFDFWNHDVSLRWLTIAAMCASLILNRICYADDGIWRGVTFIVSVLSCVVIWLTFLLI